MDFPGIDSLTDFARHMEQARIPYMVTGSVAGQFHGLDRSTMDTDVVIDLAAGREALLLAALADDWVVDGRMAADALRRRTMFNVLPTSGGKFDLIPLREEPFELAKFERRVSMDWHRTPVTVITAEDLVLSKLEWARESQSATQFRDVRLIMERGRIDEHAPYFAHWLRRLGLHEMLERAFAAGHDA